MSNGNGTVKVLIASMQPRIVDLHEGETLADFRDRMSGDNMPLNRIETLYVNGTPCGDPTTRVLKDGDVVGGTPKVQGGLR